ncbi:RNA polymerase sigma-70 factor [soil metagenome]
MKLPPDHQFTLWGKKIRRSDRNAFDQLFRSFYPILMKFAMRYTRDEASAKDVVQDCFVKLWQKRTRINPEQSLKSYLYTMVRNSALNLIRDLSDVEVNHEMANSISEAEVPEVADSSEERLEDFFATWIDQLSDRQKEAFELSRFEGLDHEEIAEVMNLSPKTVNNHIVGALRFLRDRYLQHKQQDSR